MTALVVVDSPYGTTRTVADNVAGGLSHTLAVAVRSVQDAPTELPAGVTLLVVGASSRAPGAIDPGRRMQAVPRGAARSSHGDLRGWLTAVTGLSPGLPAVAFDTHVPAGPAPGNAPGSASRAAVRRLRALGCAVILPPETFLVWGSHDPLSPVEEDRARGWGSQIGHELRRQGSLTLPA